MVTIVTFNKMYLVPHLITLNYGSTICAHRLLSVGNDLGAWSPSLYILVLISFILNLTSTSNVYKVNNSFHIAAALLLLGQCIAVK